MVVSEDTWYSLILTHIAERLTVQSLACHWWVSNTQPFSCGKNALADCVYASQCLFTRVCQELIPPNILNLLLSFICCCICIITTFSIHCLALPYEKSSKIILYYYMWHETRFLFKDTIWIMLNSVIKFHKSSSSLDSLNLLSNCKSECE